MDSCCAEGHTHSGTIQGSVSTIAGRPAYVAKSPEYHGKALLLLHDVAGWESSNNRLLADYFAAEMKALVVLPDFFDGDAVPASLFSIPGSFDIQAWVKKHSNKRDDFRSMVHVVEALKTEHGASSVGVIGYCWGGWGTLELGHTDLVKAVAVCHPSLLNMPRDVEALKQPALFLCAEKDQVFPQETSRKQAEEILKPKDLEYKFVDYPGTSHGFAARGNPNDEVVQKAYLDARQQAVQWFNHYL
ncbi:hypothetical protein BZG36_03926 [Bifiguratus adelaidae]|uniref:Dienelactone hydrolase domain-containing protein n=1 Tax=Bifiguratus adelaidae TaxID=1938954 RepID=A0A261XZ46_9FUNG|nr:hypothetical protein BZG36_03926 [Bifiguratus adelaidae]